MISYRLPITVATGLLAVIAALCTGVSAAVAAERVLHRGGVGEPETLDPQKTGSATEGTITSDLFVGLLTYGPDGMVVPGCAESWTVPPACGGLR